MGMAVCSQETIYKNQQWEDFDLWATVCQAGLETISHMGLFQMEMY